MCLNLKFLPTKWLPSDYKVTQKERKKVNETDKWMGKKIEKGKCVKDLGATEKEANWGDNNKKNFFLFLAD